MKAIVRRIGGVALAGRADSNHWITMDAPAESGGFDAGPRPLELLLIGLGGCMAMDILAVLQKQRVRLDDLEIELEADRASDHPRVFTAITLVCHFYGDGLREKDLEAAVALSQEKYCSATAMLRKSAPVDVRIEIHPPRPVR